MNFVKPGAARAAFTLLHISDFHLCCPSSAGLHRFPNKRIFSYLSWMVRRRKEHCEEVLRALVQAVRTTGFDHLAVTGDLTQLALPAEFELARRYLRDIGPPDNILVVPGNHDALVPAAWHAGRTLLADFVAADGAEAGAPAPFPTFRVRGHVALIGISTARPTLPLSAAGRIGARQLARCADLLSEAARRGLYRVLLIHHPPIAAAVSLHKRLTDVDRFLALIRRHGAELILHGHSHSRSRFDLAGPAASIPVLGVSSASTPVRDPLHRAAFRVFRIARTANGWTATCQDNAYDPCSGRFVPEQESVL